MVDEIESDPDEVNAIRSNRRREKHKNTKDGRPICDYCQKPGHIKSRCPVLAEKKKQKRNLPKDRLGVHTIVYTINNGEKAPIVVDVKVGHETWGAMLDSGAHVNVIDIQALKAVVARPKLNHFDKKLVGADGTPIVVCGRTHVPVTVGSKRTRIECVAVERLNTRLIIGMPGLDKLHIVADFHARKVWMDRKPLEVVGELFTRDKNSMVMAIDIDKGLTVDQQDQLTGVIERWKSTLVEKIEDRGPAKGYKYSINTKDDTPIYVSLRTYSPKEQEELDKQIKDMLDKHIITRTRSPWSAPVLLVKKKDNTYRVVVDYTRLNEKTVDDSYPLPVPRTTFSVLRKARYYSSLDLASGYWQVEVDPNDVPKTAFNTRKGTFAYLRMPMGLKGAPAAFQRFMTEIFSDLLYQGVLVFIDDILIYSGKWQDHLRLVDEVLKRLSEHNLQAKVGKCHFGAKEVKYLGSIVSHHCRKPDPEKVRAIKELKPPQTKDDVRSVLGLVGFYREFIEGMSAKTAPLQKLLQKNVQFEWGPEQQSAFEELKRSISENMCLEFPEPNLPYELHTDASLNGLGAVLFQRDASGKLHTIEFASKALAKAQRKQAIPVLECYAIVWALKKFRCYVHGANISSHRRYHPLTD